MENTAFFQLKFHNHLEFREFIHLYILLLFTPSTLITQLIEFFQRFELLIITFLVENIKKRKTKRDKKLQNEVKEIK